LAEHPLKPFGARHDFALFCLGKPRKVRCCGDGHFAAIYFRDQFWNAFVQNFAGALDAAAPHG
jgi:hypothetical protein